ncbi:PilZ domain-containing protein [Thiomicrorhabdus aquaedulcis]|uniref:PilZ domain-containing protein n=1 Tax=Thiomicrorhabdus aquaedulcis TaxID=2211106 RepID=UPI000FD77C7A|nr:PilZ domain-containing protein [Thiomicrorhabdus aquaedulcis]
MTNTFNTTVNQRCENRVSINRPVQMQAAAQPLSAKMLDLSSCGMGVLCPSALPAGQSLSVSFSLPDYEQEHPLCLQGEVVHTTKTQNLYLMGIVFNEMTAHQALIIRGFMGYHHRLGA